MPEQLRWTMCLCFVLSACSNGSALLADSGMMPDAAPDSGSDAGPDSGMPDSGVPDSGPDSGMPDAGPDGGPDSGMIARRPWPTLPGSAVMTQVSLVTIVASNDTEATDLFAFADALVGSYWWSTLAQAYGSDLHPTSAHLIGSPITANMSFDDQVAYIGATIADAGAFAPDGTQVYLLYLPRGISFSDSNFCGHHSHYPDLATSLGDEFGAIQQCTFQDQTIFDHQTITASHELAESVTDSPANGYRFPVPPSQVWRDSVWESIQPPRVEVGDLCEDSRTTAGTTPAYSYQRIWLDGAAADGGDPCIPPVSAPYFNLSVAQDWYPVSPGQTFQIPFTGWSTASRSDWFVNPVPANGTLSFVAGDIYAQTDLGSEDIGCGAENALNDGVNGVLFVNVPANAVPGDWEVFSIHSFDTSPLTCWPPAGEDSRHWWPVGVYVP
jgi:hypothetical protein